ncbi:MAG: GGDEF domain-containing protein, partial [Ruminococcus sp.]|nr:GGDEF domain-containing protein [Ruminococcus sp.]
MKYGYKIIALCISRIFDMENRKFVMELNEKLKQDNCRLWIYHINTDLYWEEETSRPEASVFDLVDFEIADAVIIMDEKIKSRRISDMLIAKAKKYHVPAVVVDGKHPDCTSVNFDYRAGFETIVRHVLNVHHVKNPYLMAGIAGNPFSDEREEIFKQLLAEYGIPFHENRIKYGMFWAQPAIEATEEILNSGDMPDAVICANDIMAINVSNTLRSHGIRVPEQVIVTGFDGIEEIYFSVPNMTSVRCGCSDLSESVYHAVTHALEYPEQTEQLSAKPFLIRSDSCGCGNLDGIRHIFSFNDRFYRYQDDSQVLYEVSERMQTSINIMDAGGCLFCGQLHDMTVLLNDWCTDDTKNHFQNPKPQQFSDNMLLFFETGQDNFQQRHFPKADSIPHLEKYMNKGYPLIFNALGFMGVTLGYACFHFQDYEVINYCKLPQIINILGSGLGGYINARYQNYLLKQLEFIYRYDALTGLLNRMSFIREFSKLCETVRGQDTQVTAVLSDLDNLKFINDKFGHNAGDNAIRVSALALKQSCPDDALCVRFGGDEMLAVFTGQMDISSVMSR